MSRFGDRRKQRIRRKDEPLRNIKAVLWEREKEARTGCGFICSMDKTEPEETTKE
jgi:hypothetical protein